MFEVQSPSRKQSSKCRIILSRIYFSRIMQMMYLSLILLCIASIVLNFLIQANVSGIIQLAHSALVVLEILICIIIVTEISIRIYLQGPSSCCSLSNFFDVLVTLLCIVGIVLSLQNRLLKNFENTTIDVLLVIRNIVFLARLVLVFKHQKQTNVIAVNLIHKPGSNGLKKNNELRIFGKYRPNMEVLIEEDEDDSFYSTSNAWKGIKDSGSS